jgi:hypothetical protein
VTLLLIGFAAWCSLALLVVALGRAAKVGDAQELERLAVLRAQASRAAAAAASTDAGGRRGLEAA